MQCDSYIETFANRITKISRQKVAAKNCLLYTDRIMPPSLLWMSEAVNEISEFPLFREYTLYTVCRSFRSNSFLLSGCVSPLLPSLLFFFPFFPFFLPSTLIPPSPFLFIPSNTCSMPVMVFQLSPYWSQWIGRLIHVKTFISSHVATGAGATP